MRALGIATVLALSMSASQADAAIVYNFSGTAIAGETVELDFRQLWGQDLFGEVRVEGGEVEDASILAEGLRIYMILNPRHPIDIPFSITCEASAVLPCDPHIGITNFGSGGFDTFVDKIDGIAPPGTPPGRWRPWSSYTYSTISFTIADDAAGPVSYSFKGYNTVPEPATWALMIGGFAAAGAALRRQSAKVGPV